MMDFKQRDLFDWRVKWRFGFAVFGCTRVLRIGKLCIFLWEVRS